MSTQLIKPNYFIIWLAPRAGKMNSKSRDVISYPSGQDGAMLSARDYPLYPARKFFLKAFIDQVFSVKMAGYWPRSMDLDFVSVHKVTEKELGQYPAILTSHAHLVSSPYIMSPWLAHGSFRSCRMRMSHAQTVPFRTHFSRAFPTSYVFFARVTVFTRISAKSGTKKLMKRRPRITRKNTKLFHNDKGVRSHR